MIIPPYVSGLKMLSLIKAKIMEKNLHKK